jgi:Fe2+ transport system protein FeoA
MVSDYLTCSLCGFEFVKEDTLCDHGCPLGAMCNLVRCPSCEYEFPATSPSKPSWFERFFKRGNGNRTDLPDGVRTVREMRGGERAKVLCLGGGSSSRHNTLAVFGLVPGAEVTVVQQLPSCVVRVGETELALDTEIANDIVVGSAG